MSDWRIYRGDGASRPGALADRPAAPNWRRFERQAENRAETFQAPAGVVEAVNAALYLRRPVLVTGDPGTGKSSLAYAVANELGLGRVLTWNINSRSTLANGLYDYDALARLREANLQRLRSEVARAAGGDATSPTMSDVEDIGQYITLGAIGTAFVAPIGAPRVVLIDEIDKSDVDLPNDLLHVFENGRFEILELVRIDEHSPAVDVRTLDGTTAEIQHGQVHCQEFPVVIITSNGERDLPPAFLRRCLRIDLPKPDTNMLEQIVLKHLPDVGQELMTSLIDKFDAKRAKGILATDQLLNAFYLVTQGRQMTPEDRSAIESIVLRELDGR